MPIMVKILADSVAPSGKRLVTYLATYQRMVHSEALTHRALSRNSASSRAIPASKFREMVVTEPAMPEWWGATQKGMKAEVELDEDGKRAAVDWWLRARDAAVAFHQEGEKLGLHKQILNRILEPWFWITTIITATDYANFFHLRDHKDAQPEIRELARQMRVVYNASIPNRIETGFWHLPLVSLDDRVEADKRYPTDKEQRDLWLCKISTGRCARVSYLTHEGVRDWQADIDLHDRLLHLDDPTSPKHISPAEHVAQALDEPIRCGNLSGWRQYRKTIPGECIEETPR